MPKDVWEKLGYVQKNTILVRPTKLRTFHDHRWVSRLHEDPQQPIESLDRGRAEQTKTSCSCSSTSSGSGGCGGGRSSFQQ